MDTTEGNLRVVAVPVDPNNPPPESVTLHATIAVFGEVAALKTQQDPSTNTVSALLHDNSLSNSFIDNILRYLP